MISQEVFLLSVFHITPPNLTSGGQLKFLENATYTGRVTVQFYFECRQRKLWFGLMSKRSETLKLSNLECWETTCICEM